MMRFVQVLLSVLILSLSANASAQATQTPTVKAQAILQQGGEDVVEALVEVGKVSASAAAAVMVEVAKSAPRLLEEVIRGLSVVLDEAVLQQALALAEQALRNAPTLARLLDNTIEVFGCNSVEGCARRINEVPGNLEDGSTDPVDPPASPA